jgi:hypothetical protein
MNPDSPRRLRLQARTGHGEISVISGLSYPENWPANLGGRQYASAVTGIDVSVTGPEESNLTHSRRARMCTIRRRQGVARVLLCRSEHRPPANHRQCRMNVMDLGNRQYDRLFSRIDKQAGRKENNKGDQYLIWLNFSEPFMARTITRSKEKAHGSDMQF